MRMKRSGGLITGGICVVFAGDVLEVEGVDLWRHARREADGEEEEVDVLHAGEFEGGEWRRRRFQR